MYQIPADHRSGIQLRVACRQWTRRTLSRAVKRRGYDTGMGARDQGAGAYRRITASADLIPSTAALMIPPAYPEPSPVG